MNKTMRILLCFVVILCSCNHQDITGLYVMSFDEANTLLKTGSDTLYLSKDYTYKSVSVVNGTKPIIQKGKWQNEGDGKVSLENYDWLFDNVLVEKKIGSTSYHIINFDQPPLGKTSFDMDGLHKYIYHKVK